ncbi:MAG: urea carboxylase-associated family protein [Gammaproteobacteria bacterium]|nr:urea carboxylase-associated family protein [Gammaproteobacteria bacterium]MDH3466328.1 urea carboxylase-associated family protein [Gammaproteobacteria bacterium]
MNTIGFEAAAVRDVAPCCGYGVAVSAGDAVRITDVEGQQPCDFWAFSRADVFEHLSCEHTKPSIAKRFPRIGDAAYTNRRRAIVTLLADQSPGQHDMDFAACDAARYLQLGADERHPNCADNLRLALSTLGLVLPYTPQPWNLFTNFFLESNGSFTIKAPATNAGDYVILRAEMDAYIVVSACPQDQNDTCGGRPTGLRFETGRPNL